MSRVLDSLEPSILLLKTMVTPTRFTFSVLSFPIFFLLLGAADVESARQPGARRNLRPTSAEPMKTPAPRRYLGGSPPVAFSPHRSGTLDCALAYTR